MHDSYQCKTKEYRILIIRITTWEIIYFQEEGFVAEKYQSDG